MGYDWGSRTAIAPLQGRRVPSEGPEAELWIGAHASAPSRAKGSGESVAASIVRVLMDPALRARLVAGGQAWSSRFGSDEVAEDALAIIEETISPGARLLLLQASMPTT